MAAAHPMHDAPVFLFTHGRTGSTWLQRVLNLHPNLTLWGEHYGFLFDYLKALDTFDRVDRERGAVRGDPKSRAALIGSLANLELKTEWINPFNRDELREGFRGLLLHLFARELPPEVRWGFKEVRYQDPHVPRTLARLFPKGHFVILRRELSDTLRSMVRAWASGGRWEAMDEGARWDFLAGHMKRIGRQESLFETMREEYGGRVSEVAYEDLVHSFEPTVHALFADLDLDVARIDAERLAASRVVNPHARTPPDDALQSFIEKVVQAGRLR